MSKNIFYFQWHITDFCGNRCAHCYLGEFGKTHVPIGTAFNIIDDMKDCCEELGAEIFISLTGGDPLVHPHIWQILKKVRDVGANVDILGNPELLNESMVWQLIEAGVYKYQVSLDGMETTHDKIRSKGSFRRTVDAINLLNNIGLPVTVMSTISRNNYLEMVDVMKYVYSLGVKKWHFARWTPDKGDCGISSREYSDFLKLLIQEHEPFKKSGINISTKEPLMAPANSLPIESDCVSGGCGLGSSMFSILPDNTVMACRRHAGSVLRKWQKKGDLLNLFLFHPKMNEFRNIKKIEACGICNFLNQCRGCRAAAFADSGSIFGRDPQCFMGDR